PPEERKARSPVESSTLRIEAPNATTAALLQGELMHVFEVESAPARGGSWDLCLNANGRRALGEAVFVVGRWLHECGLSSVGVRLDDRRYTVGPIGQSLRH